MTAARRPESQEQILEAAVAALTEADIPPADQDGWLDSDADPPAEPAVLPDAELAELLAAAPPRAQVLPRVGQLATGQLRAHAYLALLNGQNVDTPPPGLLPPAADLGRSGAGSTADGEPAPGPGDGPAAGGQQVPAGLRGPGPGGPPPAAGLINLTVPLTTLLGLAHAPGESAGYGPLHAGTARLLARTLAGQPATRWQVAITSPAGQALAHGTARRPATTAATGPGAGQPPRGQHSAGQPGPGQPGTAEPGRGWTVAVTAEPITTGTCGHRGAEPGYRPSPALQRLIRARAPASAP